MSVPGIGPGLCLSHLELPAAPGSATVNTVESIWMDPFQQFSSKPEKKQTQTTQNTFMSFSTFMSPNQQLGVAGCVTVGAISGGGELSRCLEPAPHNLHFSPEHQTEESSPEEERRRTNYQELWIQMQATVWPRHPNQFHASAVTLFWLRTTNPEPIQNQKWNLPIVKVVSCTRGNQAGWKPLRSLDQRMDLSLGTQFMQFKDNVTV
jgi:hypothetical protein